MTFPQIFIRFTVLATVIFLFSNTVSAETRLEARGAGFINVAPDQAKFSASVTEINRSAVDAQTKVNSAMARLEKAIAKFNLSEDSIHSGALSVNPEYRWDSDSRKQVFVGYRVTSNLEFTANDVSEIGAILTSLTESGATQVNAPQLGYFRPEDAQQQALRSAVANVLKTVRTMASAAKLSIQAIDSISEAKEHFVEPFNNLMRAEASSAVGTAPTVSVGTLRYSAGVKIIATAN